MRQFGDGVFELCPPAMRFALARRLAQTIEPQVRRRGYGRLPPNYVDDFAAHAMGRVLRRLHARDRTFDPEVIVLGADTIAAEGSILMSAHFLLNFIFLRWLADQGREVSVVIQGSHPNLTIPGVETPLDVIPRDSLVFRRVRDRVKRGRLVLVMVDSPHPLPGSRLLHTAFGPRHVCESTIRFAQRATLPICFCATVVTREFQIVTRVATPASSTTAAVADEFCEFLSASLPEHSAHDAPLNRSR